MSAGEVASRSRMSLDPDEPLFPDTPPGCRYCSCVELEDGRPVGFVRDIDCPDHGERS